MHGACGGCPSSRSTLQAGVERIVRRYVPEVLSAEETASKAPLPQQTRGGRWLAGLSSAQDTSQRALFTYRVREIGPGYPGGRRARLAAAVEPGSCASSSRNTSRFSTRSARL
jgi:hypothetical protein